MTSIFYSFTIFGVSFAFQAYMFNLFFFMWVLYALLVPVDVWTRIRILKLTDETTRSSKMRYGVAEKAQILIVMAFFSIGAYFLSGLFGGNACGFICISSGSVVSIFMGMFLITEFSSILENQLEFAHKAKIKANPVVIILAKFMGIIYTNLSNKLDEKVNLITPKK